MSINILRIEEQPWVETYNQGKRATEVIPLVLRNKETGWPLLQISLFNPPYTLPNTSEIKYDHVLGGGKCHEINMGMFSLATLLTKIPGKKELSTKKAYRFDPVAFKEGYFNVDHIGDFLSGYILTHKHIGMTVKHEIGGYGSVDTLDVLNHDALSAEDVDKFNAKMMDCLSFASSKGIGLSTTGTWHSSGYTLEQLQQCLNKEVTTFTDGQIMIDFGKFLAHSKLSETAVNYFAEIFKVDQVLELMPKQEVTAIKRELPQELKGAIDSMFNYADKLQSEPEKSQATKDLATELQTRINHFFAQGPEVSLTSGDFDQLLKECETLLHSNDALFVSKPSYKIVLNNIAIAFNQVGDAFKSGRWASSLAATKGFFAPSREEEQMQQNSNQPLPRTPGQSGE